MSTTYGLGRLLSGPEASTRNWSRLLRSVAFAFLQEGQTLIDRVKSLAPVMLHEGEYSWVLALSVVLWRLEMLWLGFIYLVDADVSLGFNTLRLLLDNFLKILTCFLTLFGFERL